MFDREAMITRLAKSKSKYLEREAARGTADGRAWAQSRAEYDQLLKLQEFDASEFHNSSDSIRMTLAEWVEGLLCDDADESVFGDGELRDEYVEAFIEGALAAWSEVTGLV